MTTTLFFQILKTAFAALFVLSIPFQYMPSGGDFEPSPAESDGDETKYIQISADDEGFDTWNPREETGGYRYGPSMILNADGSLDVWSASNGPGDIVDLVSYKRLYDGCRKSTKETVALKPTSGSHDQKWTCDPGVIKCGEYYYIGYTTTADPRGVDNDVCIARSKKPKGPFTEKWDGEKWGEDPVPLIEYTGNPECFGAGEPSFVLMGSTLYIYYTWADERGASTRVATADITDENWPAHLTYHGECIPPKISGDSSDVVYSDEYGRFIAVFTEKRFGSDSYIAVWESFDGFTFRKSGFIKENTAKRLHNCGISARADGHIGKGDPVYVSYAYGGAEEGSWGNWATRLHKVTLSLADSPAANDAEVENLDLEVERVPLSPIPQITTIKAEHQKYTINKPENILVMGIDSDGMYFPFIFGARLSGYDKSVIKVIGTVVIPVAPGTTRVHMSRFGFTGDFTVTVTESDS